LVQKNLMAEVRFREEEISPAGFAGRREALGLTVEQLARNAALKADRLRMIEANPAACNAEDAEALTKVLDRLEARQKTKSELESMIRARVRDMPITHLEVRPDKTFGWHPFVVAHPSVVVECTSRVEAIARELRAQFDLKPSRD
jgi:hypothetical protein